MKTIPDGTPCSPGCQGHMSHPCEKCGRTLCKGEVTISERVPPFPVVCSRCPDTCHVISAIWPRMVFRCRAGHERIFWIVGRDLLTLPPVDL